MSTSALLRHALLTVLAVTVPTNVYAQDVEAQYFPYEIGNRWVYDVQGTTSAGETINAQVKWTVTEVRTDAYADTLVVDAVRSDLDGHVRTHTCVIARIRAGYDFQFLEGQSLPRGLPQEEYDDYRDVCRAGGGFPFSGGNLSTSYYPYLTDLTPGDSSSVTVGSETYVTGVAAASFAYGSYTEPRNQGWHSTRVSSTFAEGIGLVETLVAENREHQQLDTLRTRLVGAEIGGVIYGDIGAVAIEDEPSGSHLGIRVGPNPTRRLLSVEVGCAERCSPIRLSLMDMRGRTVLTQDVQAFSPAVFDLGGLPSGVYVVRAESDDGAQHRRITITR